MLGKAASVTEVLDFGGRVTRQGAWYALVTSGCRLMTTRDIDGQ